MTGSRRWRVMALATGLVLAMGLWLLRPARRGPSASAAGPVVTAVPTASRVPERQGSLTLSVQSRRRVEILAGTPLFFEISLGAGRGMPPSSVGRPGQPWHGLIRLVGHPEGRPLPFAVVPLGPPRSIALASGEGGAPSVTETVADVATLGHGHVHHLLLTASPEATKELTPGTYGVRAILEGDARLESAPVTVVVRAAGEGSARDRLERERVASSAEFYLEARRFEDARRLAEELTAREPKNPGAWMLLGDALDGLGKPREALNVYRRALAVSPRTYEEPTLLYERMGAVSRKLAP